MSAVEVRQALPYVSHLKIVKHPSLSWVPAGQNEQGQQLAKRQGNQPSIQCEISYYVGDEKTFAEPFVFASRNFLQKIVDDLTAIEKPDENIMSQIAAINARLASEKLWLEDVLAKAQITDLESLWSEAFSESLDDFPQWEEPVAPVGGIPNYFRQLEWDARLALDSSKAVTVAMGVYPTPACDLVEPVRKVLQFEEGASKRQRQAQIAQNETLIADRAAGLEAIAEIKTWKAKPLSAERTAKLATFNQMIVNQPDLDAYAKQILEEQRGYADQLARLNAISYGSIATLIANPSVAASIKSMILALFSILKENVEQWKNLDMELVESRFFIPDVS